MSSCPPCRRASEQMRSGPREQSVAQARNTSKVSGKWDRPAFPSLHLCSSSREISAASAVDTSIH
eukprot:2609006-Pleurochrysis_carterae.AAC.1